MQNPHPIAQPTCVETHSVRRARFRPGSSSSSASGSKASGPGSSGM